MITLSEIETISKRATKAIGFHWGIAEEVGKNMRLLEQYGLSGIKNLNEYFKNYRNKTYQKATLILEKNISQKIPYCPIILGTNFLDQVTLLKKENEIYFENVAYPLLFLPFVSRASEIIGKRIFLKIDEKEFLLNFNESIYSNYLKLEILNKGELIKINFIENKNTFKLSEWEELHKLSKETFVEENETLKNIGAGAGLTDND